MIFVFYIASTLLVYMSYRSFRGGLEYLDYFRHEVSRPESIFTPFSTVIVPCKGLDKGLQENLLALIDQDYPAYEIVYVVDSQGDPAIPVIEAAIQKAQTAGRFSKLVIAPRSCESGQKVENLREAVLHTSERSEVFVFADSDTRPGPDWLRYLVAPLENQTVGAATGYRWFISDQITFGSELRSVWNASIASALGPNMKSNFCWGGSTSIRRETFEQLNMRERWRGTLSDDFALTRALKEAGLSVYFVPRALTASFGSCTLSEAVEFTNRQMQITRVYSPNLWLLSFMGSAIFNVVMTATVLIILLSKHNSFAVFFAITAFALVAVFSVGKSWLRLRAVEMVLGPRWPQIKKQRLTQNTLWLVTPALFLINCLVAAVSRKMTWRGIRYELKSPRETVIITD